MYENFTYCTFHTVYRMYNRQVRWKAGEQEDCATCDSSLLLKCQGVSHETAEHHFYTYKGVLSVYTRSLKVHYECNCSKLTRSPLCEVVHTCIYTDDFRDRTILCPFFFPWRGRKRGVTNISRGCRLGKHTTRENRFKPRHRLLRTCANWDATIVRHEFFFVFACC